MNLVTNAGIKSIDATWPERAADAKPDTKAVKKRRSALARIMHVLLFTMALLILGTPECHAVTVTCTLLSPLNFAPVLDTSGFGRDATIGGTSQNYSTPLNLNCSGDPSADRDIYSRFTASPATVVSGYSNLFATNLASIGVRYTLSNGAGTSCNNFPVTVTSSPTQVICHQLHQPVTPGQNYSIIVSAQFVKTSNNTAGALTSIPSLQVENWVNAQSVPPPLGNIFSGVVSGNFSTLTCSVTTTAVDVTMSQASTTRLPSIGSTDGATTFNIGVNCDAGVKVFVTLTDATPLNRTNTLSLSADSTATGIAYQILYNNNPITFGPDSSIAGNPGQFSVTAGATAGGPITIPLSARYIRTGTIQPGTVKGLATFTMSYQ